MQVSEAFLALGEDSFSLLLRHISIGKLKSFQIYEGFKVRARMPKLNTENLRKSAGKFWSRLAEGDEEFAAELAQAILISNVEMVQAVLDFLGIPNQDGFFSKGLDASAYLTEGWQQRVYEKFHGVYPEPILLLYINHLSWELAKDSELFAPAA